MRQFHRLALAVAVAQCTGLAQAEHQLPEVTVSATAYSAFSSDITATRQALEKAPGGVAVVDAEQYSRGRTGSMEDTLRLAPGVFIASRFGADEARVSIRGSGLQRTFHGRGLMLLQDGIPVNLADGGFDMQAVEPGAARYVEVQRGANALQYGSSTLGGAINYVSHTGRSAPGVTLRAEAGSFGYQRYLVNAGTQQGDWDGFVTLSHTEQNGFRDHAEQSTQRLFANLGWQASERVETRLYTTVVDTDSELPGSVNYADLLANPRKADAGSVNRDAKRDFPLYRIASKTAIQHAHGGQTVLTAFAARKQLFHPLSFARLEQRNRDMGLGVRHEHPAHVAGYKLDSVVGVSWHRGLTDDQQCNYQGPGTPPNPSPAPAGTHPCIFPVKQNKTTAENVVAYAQGSLHLSPTLQLIAGGQYTDALRRVTEDVPGLGSAGALYDTHYQRFSPKLGLQYQATKSTQLYANASGSFEPPSFSETLNNQPLLAQRGTTYELGSRINTQVGESVVGVDLSVYRALLKNELLAITLDTTNRPATTNAQDTVHQGVEFAVSTDSPHWRSALSYLWNDFRFQENAAFQGNAIAGVPSQVLNAEASVALPKDIWLGPTVRAASRSFIDHTNSTAAPGYAVWGLKLNQSLSNGFSWFVESRNLTDKTYANTTGVVLNASAGLATAQFNPGDGRSLYVGVSQRF